MQEAVFDGMRHLVELLCLEQGRMLVYGLHQMSVCNVTGAVFKERTCRHVELRKLIQGDNSKGIEATAV